MNLKKISFIISLFLAIFIFSGVKAMADDTPDNLADYEKNYNAPYDAGIKCIPPETFNEYAACKEECKAPNKCVINDSWCFYCQAASTSLMPAEQKPVLWERFKQALVKIGLGIKNVFNKIKNAVVNIINNKPEAPLKANLSDITKEIIKFGDESEKKPEQAEKIELDLDKAIAQAQNIGDIFKLQSMILLWCSQKNEGNFEAEEKCRQDLMAKLRAQGDIIKEKMLAAIDENDISADTYKKMIALRSILMAGTSARDEGILFSTENIKKVQAALKAKAQKWFKNKLNNLKLEELSSWYFFALANTSASGEGEGLFEGSDPLAQLRYRARRAALQQMIEIDICNPDPAKLAALQNLLKKEPGCEKLLGDANACKQIMAGNLLAAYNSLYNKDDGDEANQEKANQAPIPPDCKKKQAVETPQGEDAEKAAPETQPQTSPENNQPQQPADQPATNTNSNEQPPADAGSQPNENVEPIITEPPEETPQNTVPETTNPPEAEIPPAPINLPEEDVIVVPNEPLPIQTCQVNILTDSLIGWTYQLTDCNKPWTAGLGCSLECGSIPPLYIINREESLCHETAGGFIDYNVTIICHPIPLPPPHYSSCLSACLSR